MLKDVIRSILLGEKSDSKKFVKYLRKKGVIVGEDVRFYSPSHNVIDISAPHLLSIGDHVSITHGVIVLTHDYSWAVLKGMNGGVLGAQSPVKIGNNVFIGMNAIITRGVTVGNNVIIGAGSVVTKDCESNSVYAGNPAKRIMSVEEYRAKRELLQFEEAKKIAVEYINRHGSVPPQEEFSEYFMLFCGAMDAAKCKKFNEQMHNRFNFDESIAYMNSRTPLFASYKDFIDACTSDLLC